VVFSHAGRLLDCLDEDFNSHINRQTLEERDDEEDAVEERQTDRRVDVFDPGNTTDALQSESRQSHSIPHPFTHIKDLPEKHSQCPTLSL
jgi:hypothetical protein